MDTLKVLTMLLVVAGHCTYYAIETPFGGVGHLPAGGGYSLTYKSLGFVSHVIYKFHMPLFMAVSGACFSRVAGRYGDAGVLARNKARRLLLPFLLVTTFVTVPLKYLAGYWDCSAHVVRDILCGQYLLLGNSHLWFVVSLFHVFVAFHFLGKVCRAGKTPLYWAALLVLSWFGSALQRSALGREFGEMFGLRGMMCLLLYFSAGFSTFEYWDGRRPMSAAGQAASWICFVAACALLRRHAGPFASVLAFPADTVLALWGCANMVFLAKSVDARAAVRCSAPFRFMERHGYELYLYSDPFNYVLVGWLAGWFGQALFSDDAVSACAYAARFAGQLAWASLVIGVSGLAGKAVGKPGREKRRG